jgi:hypothetical protein
MHEFFVDESFVDDSYVGHHLLTAVSLTVHPPVLGHPTLRQNIPAWTAWTLLRRVTAKLKVVNAFISEAAITATFAYQAWAVIKRLWQEICR